MKSKKEIINELKNVKLVIGNGFDLYCGLKTSYSDYFNSSMYRKEMIETWYNRFSEQFLEDVRPHTYILLDKTIEKECWKETKIFDDTNIWDFFFYFVSQNNASTKTWSWCDIETKILEWLSNSGGKGSLSSMTSTEKIYRIITNKKAFYDKEFNLHACCLATIIYKKHNEKEFLDKNEFYNFLLQELKKFECNFGEYINNLQFNDPYGIFGLGLNAVYFGKALCTINELCNVSNLTSIDTFNYGIPCINELKDIVHNINGNVKNPIFGVDSNAFMAPDPRYIFTKTNRRMELDMLNDNNSEIKPCDNVVIFGSSLGVADYSYFFSIFDKINITDIEKPAKAIFAFSIYDKAKENEIKMNLTKAIFELFQEYSRYKGNEFHQNRLLDVLTTQGKIILYQIDDQKN